MNYQNKYLKYKEKYLKLKNKIQKGGEINWSTYTPFKDIAKICENQKKKLDKQIANGGPSYLYICGHESRYGIVEYLITTVKNRIPTEDDFNKFFTTNWLASDNIEEAKQEVINELLKYNIKIILNPWSFSIISPIEQSSPPIEQSSPPLEQSSLEEVNNYLKYIKTNYINIMGVFNNTYNFDKRLDKSLTPIPFNCISFNLYDNILDIYPLYHYIPNKESDDKIKFNVRNIISNIKSYYISNNFTFQYKTTDQYIEKISTEEYWQEEHFFILGRIKMIFYKGYTNIELISFDATILPRGDGHRLLCFIMKKLFNKKNINLEQRKGAEDAYLKMGFTKLDSEHMTIEYDKLIEKCNEKNKFYLNNPVKLMYTINDEAVSVEEFNKNFDI